LPDLRGRLPIHQGTGFVLAETGGAEEITLTVSQIPAHSHAVLANSQVATDTTPSSNTVPSSPSPTIYTSRTPTVGMSPQIVSSIGGSQPHNNFQPYLCVNFIISLFGIFPSPS